MRSWLNTSVRMMVAASTALMTVGMWISPSLALDPFRTSNPRAIGDTTERAFRTLFEQGNYTEAEQHLEAAAKEEPNEPLSYAMQACFAYLDEDWEDLGIHARQTRETAEKLIATDPLRGNIYTGVGHFLEGAHILATEGTVRGTPQALTKLRQVFQHLDAAEKISATDPELNLIKGFMDLMLAVTLPFSNPDQAIARLQEHAAPAYLAARGLAIGYRDMERYSDAMAAVDRAIALTPNNPELFYLKAQILVEQGRQERSQALFEQALGNFDSALAQANKFPENLREQLQKERDKTARRIQEMASANQSN